MPASAAGALLPLVLNLGEGGLEPASDVVVALDTGRRTLTIRANVPHLSTVAVTEGFITLNIDQPSDQLLRTPFHVGARVGASSDSRTFTVAGTAYELTMVGRMWTLRGGFFTGPSRIGGSILDPSSTDDPPTRTVIDIAYLAEQDFQCVLAGPFTVEYVAYVSYRWSATVVRADGMRELTYQDVTGNHGLGDRMQVSTATRSCVVPTATPSPTPASARTPTATPSPTPVPIDLPPDDGG